MMDEIYCWATHNSGKRPIKLHLWRRRNSSAVLCKEADEMFAFDLGPEQAARLAYALLGHYLTDTHQKNLRDGYGTTDGDVHPDKRMDPSYGAPRPVGSQTDSD